MTEVGQNVPQQKKMEGEAGDGPKDPGPSQLPNRLDELDLNDLVVETKDLNFSYTPKKGKLLIDINMTFPRGAIYGFLGPSGCGKTTMIKLIIGRLTPSSGKIKVNQKPISDPSNKIPGSGVGYMPQDYALYNEFTIRETMKYFARLYGLSSKYTEERIKFLVEFLELPDPNLLNGILSGGQKRRASLSLALIHNPPFLILDEPTVGVDPMLRERIWKHLVELSSQEKTSILITTHYIEECRRAHVIALMRGGHLLVENSPTNLLTHFKTNDLDKVFLQVCRLEEQADRPTLPPILAQLKEANKKTATATDKKRPIRQTSDSSFCGRLTALVIKNATKLWRQKMFLLLSISLPVIAVVLVCLTVGRKPFDLEVAVYNQEVTGLAGFRASVKYLQKINNKTIIRRDYNSNSSAQDSVRRGETFGALIIHENFTTSLYQRFNSPNMGVSDEVIDSSTIQFYADMSDLMIFQAIYKELIDAEMKFKEQMATMLNTDPNATAPIIKFKDPPVYGSTDPKFINFVAPGLLLIIVYLLSSAITTLDIVGDRREGTLDRSLVAGVSMMEILFAQIFVRSWVLVIQTVSIMVIVFAIFEIENNGRYVYIFALLMLHSINGMAFGLLMSSIAKDETMALILCVGTFMPFLVISGILWPLEGMHFILRTISIFTPQTLPVMSLRNIIMKGWGLKYTTVWMGFFVSFVYFVVFMIGSSCLSNFRQD